MKSIAVSNKMLKAAQASYEEHSHPSYGLTDADMKAAISAALALAPDQQAENERLRASNAGLIEKLLEQDHNHRIESASIAALLEKAEAERQINRHIGSPDPDCPSCSGTGTHGSSFLAIAACTSCWEEQAVE